MRFTISSGSGQTLAIGQLFIQTSETGGQKLCFRSDHGTLIEGGAIAPDGDLTDAGQELYRQFFVAWGVMGITMSSQSR
ncbi:hypothetical protein C7B65_08550 [Phormidesmis priestleyi ULC007]|uniref:Uncharacterized protein n=2 Tax=Phormidesmis priestleyi TaxID=268141 RepID=A0A2T1DIB2_9CYAN|nr:hypothetical protein C7B65_08550 [Phormidesmis priestleyi ULC007]PZO48984.1 MAG: hypothetical protein DCF14_15565 [Phormidesmis priestleyi]